MSMQICLGSNPMYGGVQFLMEFVQPRLDCSLNHRRLVTILQQILRIRMQMLHFLVRMLLFEELVLSFELVDDLVFEDVAVFDLLVVGAEGAVHVQPQNFHLVVAYFFGQYFDLLVAVVVFSVFFFGLFEFFLCFVQFLVALFECGLELSAFVGELLVLPEGFGLPALDAFYFLGGSFFEQPQLVTLPCMFLQLQQLLLQFSGCAFQLVSGMLFIGTPVGQFPSHIFQLMGHPAYLLLVFLVDELKFVELILVVLQTAAVGADDGFVLLVDVLLALELKFDIGVVGLCQLQGLVVFVYFCIFAGQQILQSLDFFVEVVGGCEFSGAFLLVVEFIGHFTKFLVLLDHDIPQLLVLLAQNLILPRMLLLLQQHLPHLHQIAILLAQHLQQLLILMLQIVVLVELPSDVLVFDLLLAQTLLAFVQLLLQLFEFLTEGEFFTLALEQVFAEVVELASELFGDFAHAVVHGVDGRGVHVDLSNGGTFVVHEGELILQVPHDGVLLIEVAFQQPGLLLQRAYHLVLLIGDGLEAVDEFSDLHVGHLEFVFVGLVAEVEFGVEFADVHLELHDAGVVVEGFHAAAFEQHLGVVAAFHGGGGQMSRVVLGGARVFLEGAGVVQLAVVVLLALFAFGLQQSVLLFEFHQHDALLVHVLHLLLVFQGQVLQAGLQLLVFGLQVGDQHRFLLQGGLHGREVAGTVFGGLRHDGHLVLAAGVAELLHLVDQFGDLLLALPQQSVDFVAVWWGAVEGVLQLLDLLEVALVFVQFGVVLRQQLLVGHLQLGVVLLQGSELASQYLHLPSLLHFGHFPSATGLLILLLPVRSLPEGLVVVSLAEEGTVGGAGACPFGDDLGGRDVGVEHGVPGHYSLSGRAVVEVYARVGAVHSPLLDQAVPHPRLLALQPALARVARLRAGQLAYDQCFLGGQRLLDGVAEGVQGFENLGLGGDGLPHHCDVGDVRAGRVVGLQGGGEQGGDGGGLGEVSVLLGRGGGCRWAGGVVRLFKQARRALVRQVVVLRLP